MIGSLHLLIKLIPCKQFLHQLFFPLMDNKNSFFFLLLILLLANTRLPPTSSHPLPIVETSTDQLHTYIVQVEHPEGITLLSSRQRDEFYKSFLPNTALDSGKPRLIYSYDTVMTGFAARLTLEEITTMKSLDGFVHAHEENIYTLQTTYTPRLLGLNGWKSLWKESDEGEGVIVGVIDSGITPTHPSFADDGSLQLPPLKWRGSCGFKNSSLCNNKLIGAVAFKKGKSPEPYDTLGHGTHVAGIAVGVPVYDAGVTGEARGTAVGMAPRAHLAVYQGCRGDGTCRESDTMKCIEQAIKDGVDVINMSFGSKESTLVETSAQGTYMAMKYRNISSVASAMNSGPFQSRISHTAPWITTVGAATTDRRVTSIVKLGNGMVFEGQSAYQPNPSNLTAMLPLVYPGVNKTQETLTCQNGSMEGFDVKGKMVLCGTGGKNGDRVDKGKIVKEAGGAAMLILSQPWEGYTTASDPHHIPASHVSYIDSMKILNYIQTDPNPTATIEFKGTNFGARPSPTVASFSARGPSLINGGILKPDMIAPGVNIISAWHKEVGPNPVGSNNTFSFASGTSMAAPHVTGITALLKKTHPDWSPAAIKSALMTTAFRYDRDGNPISDDSSTRLGPASAFAVGAGHVNPPDANDPGLIYDITPDDYTSYLCGLPRLSDMQVSFIVGEPTQCSTRPKISTEQLNYPSILVSLSKSSLKTTVCKKLAECKKIAVDRAVTNVGEANTEYTAKVTEPNGVEVVVEPTTLRFSEIGQKERFSVEMSLAGKAPGRNDVLEGEILWASSDGKYSVRSPIVVTA